MRAFEAAARHATFQAAGEELGVSAGAVAQHVRGLEDWLGLPLFRRLPSRGVALTPAGERYALDIRDLLDGLAEATLRAMRRDGAHRLTVSTIPSFAALWLIPRLGEFRRHAPGLEPRIIASGELTDFGREEVDVAVRFGRGPYPGLRVDHLLTETVFPVCSPALREGLRRPEDLAAHVLLHEAEDTVSPNQVTWADWLAAMGVAGVDPEPGPRFTHTFMVLQAAAIGQGVALATSVLGGDLLATGQLVRPFAAEVPGRASYLVVAPEASADSPKVTLFRDWILAAARP